MYKVKTYDKTTRVDLIWDDEKKQHLSTYVSDFEQPCVCELYEAVKKIKNNTLPSYALGMDLYIIKMNKDGVLIRYSDGVTTEDDHYTLDELEEMINIYCDEFQKVYGTDLRQVDEDYEPLVEGVIPEELITGDDRVKRTFN